MPKLASLLTLLVAAASADAQNAPVPAQDLGTLGGRFGHAYGQAVNEAGHVAGVTVDRQGLPDLFVWTPEAGMRSLGVPADSVIGINASGQIAGTYRSPDSDTHAFLWSPAGGLQDLGTLGGYYSEARALNNSGQVAGVSMNASAENHAFLWTPGIGMRDLGTLGGTMSEATCLNSKGEVGGTATTPGNAAVHAVVWKNEHLRNFGTLGGGIAAVSAINEKGDIAGTCQLPDWTRVGFFGRNGSLTDLGSFNPADRFTFALHLNDAGVVVGHSVGHPFRWTAETGLQDLLKPGSSSGEAIRVDESGRVLVSNYETWYSDPQGYVWEAGSFRDLGTLGKETLLTAMSRSGYVTGYSRTGGDFQHAFRWSPTTGLRDLGTLGQEVSEATAVNDSGAVVGESVTPSGYLHAFYWTASTGMLDLGSLGDTNSRAIAVNAAGQVLCRTTNGTPRSFVWSQAAGRVDIGSLGGGETEARAINGKGHVVGRSLTIERRWHAFFWTPTAGMRDLGAFYLESEAIAINDAGMVAGNSALMSGTWHAFAWKADLNGGALLDLGTLGGAWSTAVAVNKAGTIVGHSYRVDGKQHFFRWRTGGTMVDNGELGGDHVAATGFNNKGEICGWGNSPDYVTVPCIRTGGRNYILETFPEAAWAEAYAINELSQVVGAGYSNSENGWRAFASTLAGGGRELLTLGGRESFAVDINELSQAVGWTFLPTGEKRAVMWTIP